MTAKEYLKEIEACEIRYKTKLEEVENMHQLAEATSAIRYDKDPVQTSPRNDEMINAIIKIDQAELNAYKAVIDFVEQRNTKVNEIMGLEDAIYSKILYCRYVKYQSLDEIAEQMHYSYDWMKHLHGSALTAFSDKYPYILAL